MMRQYELVEKVAAYDTGPSIGIGGLKVRFGIMPGNYNESADDEVLFDLEAVRMTSAVGNTDTLNERRLDDSLLR